MAGNANQRTIKQHYIPQFFIRRFADGDKKVWCLDRDTLQLSHVSSKSICYNNDYYERAGLDPNQIENGLSVIESKAANIFKRLDEGILPENLTRDEKIDLSLFLNALYFRTPFFVNAMMDGAKQLPASPEYQEWVNWLQIGAMTDENLPIQFYKMQTYVIENTSDIDFPLSDFPFVGARLRPSKDGKYEIVTELGSGTISLFDADVAIMVPIGPKKILIMTHDRALDLEKMKEHMPELARYAVYEMNRTYQKHIMSGKKPHLMKTE